jgi:PAS domain S-box-containing protein
VDIPTLQTPTSGKALALGAPELQWIYDTAPIGLAFLSPDCRYLQINQRLTEICGISVADHLGHSVREMVPNVAEQVEKLVQFIVTTGEPVIGIEVGGQRADKVGADRCWLTSWHPLKGPDGRVLGVNVAAEEITDRKRAQAAVTASEQRYRALAAAISSIVWTTAADGQVVDMPEWGAFTGQSTHEMRGWGWLNAIHPDDRDRTHLLWQRAVTTGSLYEVEYRIRRRDGSYVWHQVRGVAVVEDDDFIREWVGICLDIDDRKRAEQQSQAALHVSEERWRLVFETSTLGILLTDHDLKFIEANSAFKTMLGYSAEELRNISPADLFMDEERETSFARMLELREGKRSNYEVVTRYKRKDGTFIWVNTFVSTIPGKRSDLPMFFATAIDVTDRQRAETELRRTATYLAEAEKLSHTGSWARNTKTGELFWSQEEWRIFGLDPATTKLSYQIFLDLVHPEDRKALQEESLRAVGENRAYNIPFRAVLRDGTVKHIHSVGKPVFEESGEVVEYIGVSMDETERIRATAAVHEAQAELARVARLTTMGELTASIAHEINQPLAAVVSSGNAALRWLAHATPNLEEATTAIKRIVNEANRASDVIGRIRSFLRHRKPEYVAIDINGALREVLALTMSSMQARKITIQTDLLAVLPSALGDRVQLQQVLMNLVMNGADAMSAITDRPRVLRISSQRDESGKVLVTIGDSGTGIDEIIRNRIFEPLFTTKTTGMGMGLSICRSIVEAHGGRLWSLPGMPHGTNFHFTVPSTAAPPANPA